MSKECSEAYKKWLNMAYQELKAHQDDRVWILFFDGKRYSDLEDRTFWNSKSEAIDSMKSHLIEKNIISGPEESRFFSSFFNKYCVLQLVELKDAK